MKLSNLRFMPDSDLVSSSSHLFRPIDFPPSDDWPMSVDANRNHLSKFRDNFWDFRAFSKPVTFNFDRHGLSAANISIIKKTMFLVIYHPNLFPGELKSCNYCYYCIIKIAKVCEASGVLLTDVSKLPNLFPSIADALQGTSFRARLSFLHKLWLYGPEFGINYINENLLKFLTKKVLNLEGIQTAYIPPRIWSYQINRLKECIDDFMVHKDSIEQAFVFILSAYKHNESVTSSKKYHSPFGDITVMRDKRIIYSSGYVHFLKDYDLHTMFTKWIGPINRAGIRGFARYLSLVRDAAMLYILNFSLQRTSEATSLKSDCFTIEIDQKIGKIAMISGETTKTDPDDDARWVVHESVSSAVEVAGFIAKLRRLVYENKRSITELEDISTPLCLSPVEPWTVLEPRSSNNSFLRTTKLRYQPFLQANPLIFERERILVTESDWKIAIAMTPNLGEDPKFQIGKPWPFSCHQLRRTSAVNMVASNMVSDNSLQWSLKHLSRNMTLYYARNYSNLKLNKEAEALLLTEAYNAIYTQLENVLNDNDTFFRPHKLLGSTNEIINLIGSKDEKKLLKLIRNGQIECRRTNLGFCMKPGPCEYGGIESVTKCVNGNGDSRVICSEAIFDKRNETQLRKLRSAHLHSMSKLESNEIRYKALSAEVQAIGVYLNVIESKH